MAASAAGARSQRVREVGTDSTVPVVAPTRLAGAYWASLTPAERQIYLQGFLAGAAAEQGRTAAAVDSLRSTGALHFAFTPSVYAAQLDDFYWWQDRVATPIVAAMMMSNGGR
jgi:hypothetical protein